MRESLRRIILFILIVTVGSIAILLDLPLIIMIPLIIAVGFIILLVTGALTVSEIKVFFKRKSPDIKKVSGIKKDSFFHRIKKTKPVDSTVSKSGGKTPPLPVKKDAVKSKDTKDAKVSRFPSFFSAIRSLGMVMQNRRDRSKRVEEIDKQLDSTISQNIASTERTATGFEEKTGMKGAGAVSASVDIPKDQDSIPSLSADEFDADLLAGLDDNDISSTPPDEAGVAAPDSNAIADTLVSDDSVSLPSSPDAHPAAPDVPKGNDKGGSDTFTQLEELSEQVESLETDLGDLEGLNLDEAFPDPGADKQTPESTEVKTQDWVVSDAPIQVDAPPQVEAESSAVDMAAFTGGTGSDDDLLSSLSSEIKHVKKEDDLSLLRDLKDFRATANEIESELSEIYGNLMTKKNPEK